MLEWNTADLPERVDAKRVWVWSNWCDGIKLVEYWSAERLAASFGGNPDEFNAGWYDVFNTDEDHPPHHWLPHDALPEPPKEEG